MEIVIKIPDEDYEYLKRHNKNGLYNAILNGTPLPKGHGRLKDIDKVERLLDLEKPDNAIAKALKNIIESVPIIVEAES